MELDILSKGEKITEIEEPSINEYGHISLLVRTYPNTQYLLKVERDVGRKLSLIGYEKVFSSGSTYHLFEDYVLSIKSGNSMVVTDVNTGVALLRLEYHKEDFVLHKLIKTKDPLIVIAVLQDDISI